MGLVRRCRDDERTEILAIVNAAAEAYRGVIPPDRWREPYMPRRELDDEIAAGVDFWGYEDGGVLVNPMIVDGQIYGGLAQGIGTALYEEMPFDTAGQPLATTLADYLLPGPT